MTPQLHNLLIVLGGIAIVLILIILFFSGNSRFMRYITKFLENKEQEDKYSRAKKRREGNTEQPVDVSPDDRENVRRFRKMQVQSYENEQRRTSSEAIVEMATLVQKSDDRLRIIESTGQTRLVDEYYELVFITRKGKKVKIECSRDAYEKIPFNQQGSLTYRRNKLVKFKYYEDIVYDS